MVEKDNEFLSQIVDRYEQIDGGKILEALKNFEFNHEAKTFEKACLERAVEYLKSKDGEMTDEEFLALLIRLTMMHFVQVKYSSNMWYLILCGLLSEDIQRAKMSEVVKRFEEQFIEYMEMLSKVSGEEVIKRAVFIFLFKENADFVFPLLQTTEALMSQVSRFLH